MNFASNEPQFKTDARLLDANGRDILKKEKENAMEKTAGYSHSRQAPYSKPYLNLSDTKLPESMRELFELCKYFYMFDPIISGAVNSLSTFPITEVYFEESKAYEEIENEEKEEESDELKLNKSVISKRINLTKLSISIGIDYFLYGNCFIFGEFNKDGTWKHLIKLDPSKITIEKNEATQEKTYKWTVPENIKRIVKDKKPKEEYEKIPQKLRDAAEKDKMIRLSNENIYHLARPSDSMGDSEWGIPVVANVMKLLMYRNTLRRAQEAIAQEHIVPFRIYYFERTETYNTINNWENVTENFTSELKKASRDPNYKVVSPVPVNTLNLGGHGKSLMLTPEIEQVQAEILAGMNVPREFIFGGVSWSGSSISLKILENHFETYRMILKDFIQNFVIKGMAKKRGVWKSDEDDDKLITVKMADLKMQDDVQQKQLIINLNQAGKVTDELVWKSIGVDPDKMRESLKDEMLQNVEIEKNIKIAQIEANTEIQIAQMKQQAKLQQAQAEFQASIPGGEQQGMVEDPMIPGGEIPEDQSQYQEEGVGEHPQGEGAGSEGQNIDESHIKEVVDMLVSAEDQSEFEKIMSSIRPEFRDVVMKYYEAAKNAKEQGDFGRGFMDAQNIAMELIKHDPETRKQMMSKIPEPMKSKVKEVLMQLEEQLDDEKRQMIESQENKGQGQGKGEVDMRPMPEQLPPRRK